MELSRIEPFLDYLGSIHARTRRVVTCIPPDDLEWSPAPGKFSFGDIVRHLAAKCATPAGTPITTWKWLRAMLEHEAHHRGQLSLMLGLRGVTPPPIYGLTSEEVRDRSLPATP